MHKLSSFPRRWVGENACVFMKNCFFPLLPSLHPHQKTYGQVSLNHYQLTVSFTMCPAYLQTPLQQTSHLTHILFLLAGSQLHESRFLTIHLQLLLSSCCLVSATSKCQLPKLVLQSPLQVCSAEIPHTWLLISLQRCQIVQMLNSRTAASASFT